MNLIVEIRSKYFSLKRGFISFRFGCATIVRLCVILDKEHKRKEISAVSLLVDGCETSTTTKDYGKKQ